MASTAVATVIKMIESLPEDAQDQVVEHLRDYLEEMKDDASGTMRSRRPSHSLLRRRAVRNER